MSGPGVSPGEMPGFPFIRRRARDLDEPLLDALLAGQALPPDAPEQAHAVAAILGSLVIPAGPGPLAGEAGARSAFARAASPAGILPTSPAARRGRARPRVRLRLVTAVVAVTTVLGGVAAAWADVLPGPIQELAHQVFGAPAASRPSPRAPASLLCSAYKRAQMHGGPRAIAAAHARLAKAAGGASKIGRYCASIPQPGAGQAGPGTRQHGRHGSKNNRGKANDHAKQGGPGRAHGHSASRNGRGPVNGNAGQGSHGRP